MFFEILIRIKLYSQIYVVINIFEYNSYAYGKTKISMLYWRDLLKADALKQGFIVFGYSSEKSLKLCVKYEDETTDVMKILFLFLKN